MKRTSENIKDPLFRCVEREVNFAANLLRIVRQDLDDIQAVCEGNKKQTNDTREILNNLSKGISSFISQTSTEVYIQVLHRVHGRNIVFHHELVPCNGCRILLLV